MEEEESKLNDFVAGAFLIGIFLLPIIIVVWSFPPR